MIIYVLKNDAGEYLCYDRDYGMTYTDKAMRFAIQYYDWKSAKEHAERNNVLGKFELYRWEITEQKDEE